MEPKRKQRREERRSYIEAHKDLPCADCGKSFPRVCMDFHHIDENTKDEVIKRRRNSLISTAQKWSIARIDAELAKCVVLCACCHRIRHHA